MNIENLKQLIELSRLLDDMESSPKKYYDGYKIVRTYSSGVWAGYIESRHGQEVIMKDARRLWRWYAASLSELAMSGTPNAENCKFPESVNRVELLNVIEILDCTTISEKSIKGVPVWKAQP